MFTLVCLLSCAVGECGSGKSSLVNAVLQKLGCELADVRYAITRKNVEDALLRRKFGGDDSQYAPTALISELSNIFSEHDLCMFM